MAEPHANYNLQRFKDAQDTCYHRVTKELMHGRKLTHWIWYIFPQVEGLGRSSTAEHYSIKSLDEAKAYLNDALLGGRLEECCQLLLSAQENNIQSIMGYPDDLKLCSSMTLFANLKGEESVCHQVLKRFFEGQQDTLTLQKMKQWQVQ